MRFSLRSLCIGPLTMTIFAFRYEGAVQPYCRRTSSPKTHMREKVSSPPHPIG
jgi:hypothetical protein